MAQDSSLSLLATSIILSFTSIGYLFHYFQKKIDTLERTKKTIDQEESLEEAVYPSWSGTFADETTSLIVTIVWKKESSRKENAKWIEWGGEEDGSVVNRNFYLGNENPSFDWDITARDFDTKAVVKETFMDGWNSVIQLKVTAFVREQKTKEEMNRFLQELVERHQIDWQKSTISKEETIVIFE